MVWAGEKHLNPQSFSYRYPEPILNGWGKQQGGIITDTELQSVGLDS
jgi:hypothetical protein